MGINHSSRTCRVMRHSQTYRVFVLLSVVMPSTFGQEVSSGWEFFPGKTDFAPPTANYEEARMSVHKEIGEANLIVGIGNMFDLARYRDRSLAISLGAEFFAYGLAMGIAGPALPIDAADGYFGGHATLRWDSPISARLRVLHISAHYVDGHYDKALGAWRGGREPRLVFRNFAELVGAYELPGSSSRMLAGFSADFNRKPTSMRPLRGLAGIEWHSARVPNLYGSYVARLIGTPIYAMSHSIEGGVKFGEWSGQGVRFFVYYYSGPGVMGQYFDVREEEWGAGFSFDYW